VNDEIAFFDGVVNLDFVYSIKKIAKREIVFDFVESYEINNEIDFNLNLYQALPNKLEKLEYILQK
jgi:16S rRNA U1498 N3-methylase RsmE